MGYTEYHKLRALVVDDFDSFRHTISKMLENFGVTAIESAVSGAETVRWCSEKAFDIILCDYNLGQGKTGQQVLEELRHKNILSRRSLFILISAESSRSIIMSAYDYEPDAYLAKPITGKSLKQRLDRLLEQRDEMMPIYSAIDDGLVEEAAQMLREKVAANSRISNACQKQLAELYFNTQQYEKAENVYREALETRTLEWAQVGMARVSAAMEKADVAQEWLEDIVRKNPLCMPAYDELAKIHKTSGDKEQLVDVLRRAVEYSPMAILRQEYLAKISVEVNDYATAAEAYRQTVRLGSNSCHNKTENHLNFGRTTAAWLAEDEDATELAREAVRSLEAIDNHFHLTEEQKVQVLLIESQVFFGQGQKRRAQETLQHAEDKLESLPEVRDVDTELDMVVALRTSGQDEKAEQHLRSVIATYKNNQEALKKIDRLLEEPLSEENRKKVASINKEGIGYYERKEFKDAIECFKNARKLFPNHIGIQLNLIQAYDGELREFGYEKDMHTLAKKCLRRVGGKISDAHREYSRYLQLHDMLESHSP